MRTGGILLLFFFMCDELLDSVRGGGCLTVHKGNGRVRCLSVRVSIGAATCGSGQTVDRYRLYQVL